MNSLKEKITDIIHRISEHLTHRRLFDAIVVLAAVVVGILCGCVEIAPGVEQTAISHSILAAASPAESGQRVVVVMCTDNTIERLAPDTGWPIDRSYYTQMLSGALSEADTVIFDILFADSAGEDTDRAFAEAVSAHGGVVLARSETTLPIDPLFYSGARMGYAVEFDENGSDAVSRSYKLYFNDDLRTGPTLICSALLSQGYAVEYDGRGAYAITSPDGEAVRLRVDDDGYFYRLPSQHGTDIQVIDLYDVVSGSCDPSLFRDAVVFVGGTVAGFEDIVYAPDFEAGGNYSGGSAAMRVVGTKYLADCYLTVLRGFSPATASPAIEGIICALLFLLTALLALRISVKNNWLIPALVGFGWFGLARSLFVAGLVSLPVAEPIIFCAAAYLAAIIMRLVHTSRERTISSLPIETLYRIAYELDDMDSGVEFDDYIRSFEKDVFRQLGVNIISAQSDRPEIISEGSTGGTVVTRSRAVYEQYGRRALIVIPLPSFGDEETRFTLLGTDRRTPSSWVQSVTALVLAMYVYHKANRQSAEKQQMAMTMIEMIIQMIDAKDPVTAGHSRRVSSYSRQIAEWLGYSRSKAADVEFAALLHDIGKIGVADSVLNKPGLFTDDDFAQMRSHPALGADIVRTIGLSEDIIDGVLHHHERLDGRGYPDGSAGGEYARIIKVADVYDALTSQRQYKSAWNTSRALDVIYNGIGTEFDERIAAAFIRNTAPEGYQPNRRQEQRGGSGSTPARLIDFAVQLWQRSKEPLLCKHPTMSAAEEGFSFDCTRRFAGLEWGERFSSPAVLRRAPDILCYDEENGSVISALAGKPEDIIHSAVCYFHKGCLSAGIAAVPGGLALKAETLLTRLYQKPANENGHLVWKARNHAIIKVHSDGISAFVFVTNYLSNEI